MPEVGAQAGAVCTSTKPQAAEGAGAAQAAWEAAQRFFNSPPLTRKRVATRVIGNVAVQAMACSHRYWGMGSAGVGRVWRQWSNRSATWVRWCSACAGVMVAVFICASKSGGVLWDTVS